MAESDSEPGSLSSVTGMGPASVLIGRGLVIFGLALAGAALVSPVFGLEIAGAGSAAVPERGQLALWGLLAVMLVISALVSGAETAIFSLTKVDVARARNLPSRSHRALIRLLDSPNDTLTTLLVLNNLINVALSLTAGALTESYFSTFTAGGVVIAAFAATSLILIFGEITPKCLAQAKARSMARMAALPMAVASRLLTPVRSIMNVFIHWVFDLLKIPETKITDRVSQEDLRAIMSTGEAAALLEEDEREMIHGVFELSDTFAEEIMIPRAEVQALPDTLDQRSMLEHLRQAKHKRIPIYHENLDDLAGFVLVKEVLLSPERPWRDCLRELPCFPSRVLLVDLLDRFRKDSIKIAGLVDEYGGVDGIVTLHELLEEIVGDITELHETVTVDFLQLGEGHWRVRGHMNLTDLGQRLGVVFPDDLGATAGGFVMNKLGKVPRTGDELRFGALSFTVTRMIGRRITQIEVVRAPEETESAAREASGGLGS